MIAPVMLAKADFKKWAFFFFQYESSLFEKVQKERKLR